jgi:hypothetical protein
VFLGGALLALGLARRSLLAPDGDAATAPASPVRAVTVAAGRAAERADAFIRRWPSASIAMLTLAALFAWLLGAP